MLQKLSALLLRINERISHYKELPNARNLYSPDGVYHRSYREAIANDVVRSIQWIDDNGLSAVTGLEFGVGLSLGFFSVSANFDPKLGTDDWRKYVVSPSSLATEIACIMERDDDALKAAARTAALHWLNIDLNSGLTTRK